MLTPDKKAIRSISIKDILEALAGAPEAWPQARAGLIAFLNRLILAVPETLRGGLEALRDKIAAATEMPPDLIGDVLKALKSAVLVWDFGPATGDDSDLA